MVSILSFFQNKKKGKRTRSRSPSPTSTSSPTNSSSTPPPAGGATRPTRFLSLRQKSGSSSSTSTTKPYDISGRRNSHDLNRKKSSSKSTARTRDDKSKNELTTAFIPKLDLGFDIPKTQDAIQNDTLDIHGVGEIIPLRQDEIGVIGELELSVDEVKLAWDVIGKALRLSDLNTYGLMLPLRTNTDSTTQLYILALYTLTIRPDLLSKFPTISAQFAQPISNPTQIWKERLISVVKDVNTISDLAEFLKYTLRRLHPRPPEPLFDIGLYTKFVQAEHAASYPLDAYETLLIPRLKAGIPNYLNEIFEVWSAIITHAEQNAMTPSRLAHLLGWWIWGPSNGKFDNWESLYQDWKSSGGRMEHLLYVWIRYQSTKSQLPTRLLEVIEQYPFGESSTSSDHLPILTHSSLPSRTLHVTLTSSLPVSDLFQTPEDILKESISANIDESVAVPLWSTICEEGEVDSKEKISEDSLKFLREADRINNGTPPPSPHLTQAETPAPVNTTPMYRPFSTISNGGTSRGRFKSHSGDISSPTSNLSSSTTSPNLAALTTKEPADTSPKLVKKQASLGVLPKNGDSIWDDFKTSGFGDSPKTVNDLGLAFSPKSTSKSLSPTGSDVRLAPGSDVVRPVPKKRATFDDPKKQKPVYGIAKEEVIEINDTFISFVEDAQLDPPSVASWPPFTLVRLASPLTVRDTDKPIEWLLVTVTHRPPPPPPQPQAPESNIERSTSPSSSKGNTPRGFIGITESFKRSSSFQSGMNLRKSFFGTSSFTLSRHTSDELATLPESQSGEARELRAPLSAQSLTPTEYTITEMGEMIKIPSPNAQNEPFTTEPSTSEQSLTIDKDNADVATIKGKDMNVTISSGPSVYTLASQWQYVGEGAEHIVFAHRGTLSEYNGKVLRLRKSQFLGNSPTDPEYRQTLNEWMFNLLPKLVPSDLLISTREVILSEGWTKDLFTQADATRPEERKLLGDLKSLVVGEAKGVIMEDTTTNEKNDGIANLAFEIKPKWGFLPDPTTITPPEAAEIKSKHCRFCMHRHLKGHDSSAEGKFCPLDLYSGDEDRMRKAIKGLWGIWEESGGKENNWRVFVDGERVNPGKVEGLGTLFSNDNLVDEIASIIIPIIKTSDVFTTLKDLQSTLDPTDISDLSSRFSDAHPEAEVFDPALIPSPTAPELKEFVELYLSSPTSGKKEDIWSLRQRMIAFALSAIFKDCSVFVKFTLSSDHNPANTKWNLVEGSGKVKMIDLDLKPIQNLRKWKETDDKIWKYWLETHPPSPLPPITENIDPNQEVIFSETDKEDFVDQQQLDIPVRHKTISGLTIGVSEYGSDGASTRALFVPTPDRTRENTPLPTPLPTTATFPDDQSQKESVNDSQDPIDGVIDQSEVEQEGLDEADNAEIPKVEDEEEPTSNVPFPNSNLQSQDETHAPVPGLVNRGTDQEEIEETIVKSSHVTEHPQDEVEMEARRVKRSLAPSPSPPPAPAMELPKVGRELDDQDKPTKSEVFTASLESLENHDEETSVNSPNVPVTELPKEVHQTRSPVDRNPEASSLTTADDANTIASKGEDIVEGVVEAGIAGAGVLVGLAASAVHAVIEASSGNAEIPEIEAEATNTAEEHRGSQPDNEELSATQVEHPQTEDTDAARESAEPRISEIPQEQDDDDTPKAELDNFYTPAETPLISQPFTFDRPVISEDLSALTASVSLDSDSVSPDPSTSVNRVQEGQSHPQAHEDVVERVQEDSEHGEQVSTLESPKLADVPIEDATPKEEESINDLVDLKNPSDAPEQVASDHPLDHPAESDEIDPVNLVPKDNDLTHSDNDQTATPAPAAHSFSVSESSPSVQNTTASLREPQDQDEPAVTAEDQEVSPVIDQAASIGSPHTIEREEPALFQPSEPTVAASSVNVPDISKVQALPEEQIETSSVSHIDDNLPEVEEDKAYPESEAPAARSKELESPPSPKIIDSKMSTEPPVQETHTAKLPPLLGHPISTSTLPIPVNEQDVSETDDQVALSESKQNAPPTSEGTHDTATISEEGQSPVLAKRPLNGPLDITHKVEQRAENTNDSVEKEIPKAKSEIVEELPKISESDHPMENKAVKVPNTDEDIVERPEEDYQTHQSDQDNDEPSNHTPKLENPYAQDVEPLENEDKVEELPQNATSKISSKLVNESTTAVIEPETIHQNPANETRIDAHPVEIQDEDEKHHQAS